MNGFRISVPASSANLGPGFDCLALAVNLHLELQVEPIDESLEIRNSGEGADILPRDPENRLYQAIERALQIYGRAVPGLRLTVRNRIPIGSGLGSSSAALIAGLMAGGALASQEPDPGLILEQARELEGHADNAAASLFGGLVAVEAGQGEISWLQLPLASLKLVLVVPAAGHSTREMRDVLPDTVDHAAASRSLSRIPFLLEGLRTGDLEMLSRASKDELHEPHRLLQIGGAAQARLAGLAAGAAAVVLSGAGPGLLAFVGEEGEAVGEAMRVAFQGAGVKSRAFHLRPATAGARVTRLDA